MDYLSNTKPVKAAVNAWNNLKDDWAKLWSKETKKEADRQNDYKNSQEAYDAAYKVAVDKNLLGKPYGEGGYVCTSFVKDERTGLGLNADDYIKSLRAADNIALVTGLLPESKTQPSAGTYVFYKEYANKELNGSGHVGIVKINDDGTSLILHNGVAADGSFEVNVYKRTATNDFNNWFQKGERTGNPVRYKPLNIPR